MPRPQAVDEPTYLATRPAREAVGEIAGLSLAFTGLWVLPMTFPIDGLEWYQRLQVVAPALGEEVFSHIDWGFGIYIPVLLGFYAIVLGGQLSESPSAGRNRRVLALVAESLAASLTPAILLVLAACIASPVRFGALLIIIPAWVLTVFLAVQLGGFAVFEAAMRLRAAAETMAWTESRLRAIGEPSHRPPWVTVAATAVSLGGIGALIFSALTPSGSWAIYAVSLLTFFCLALGLCLFYWSTAAMLYTARDVVAKIAAWMLGGSFALLLLVVIAETWLKGGSAIAIAMVAVLALCLLSALPQPPRLRPLIGGSSLNGAARTTAARSLGRIRLKSLAVIAELDTQHRHGEPRRVRGLIEKLTRR